MKALSFLAVVGLALAVPAVASAGAIETLYSIYVNEHGNGTYVNETSGGTGTLPEVSATFTYDSHIYTPVANYVLPFVFQNSSKVATAPGVTQGWFGMDDVGTDPSTASDLIGFHNEKFTVDGGTVTLGVLSFFSADDFPMPPVPAGDIDASAHEDQTTGIAVYSTEGFGTFNGEPGIPGDPLEGTEADYTFVSDVPEPAGIVALFGLGGMGALGLVWRRRRA
jgi:hypothetical protein